MENTENNTAVENTEDQVAALESAVETADTAVETATQANVEAQAAAKEAVKNHKAAVAYAKSVTGDAQEEANAAVEGWAGEVERTKTVADEAKQALKDAKEALKEAKKALKAGGAAKEKEPRVEQNGQVAPRPTSKSGQLWAIFDAATEERGSTCAVADVMDQCAALGLTEGSIRSAYSHWRKFHGVEKGRIQSVNAPAMSEEKRAAEIEKLSEQLAKAEARVATLREKLAAVESAPTEGEPEAA